METNIKFLCSRGDKSHVHEVRVKVLSSYTGSVSVSSVTKGRWYLICTSVSLDVY